MVEHCARLDWQVYEMIDAARIIQLMISPAVMISACGLLLLSANNKYSSVLNRIRLMSAERRHLVTKAAEGKLVPEDNIRLESAARQLSDLGSRAKLVRNAVLSYTTAIGFFVLCSLFIGIALFTGDALIHCISIFAFLAGMIMLFVGAVFGVLESRKGYNIVQLEIKAEE